MIIRQGSSQATGTVLRATKTDEWSVRVEVGAVTEAGEPVTITLIVSTNEVARLINATAKAA